METCILNGQKLYFHIAKHILECKNNKKMWKWG